jgi:hypothetical protein
MRYLPSLALTAADADVPREIKNSNVNKLKMQKQKRN